LVFGLALSIGSIILISKIPQTPDDIVSAIELFGPSFLIVVWIWSGYTRVMISLPFETEGTFTLNIFLLFLVATEPYLFYVLEESPHSLQDFASSVYALDVGAMMLVLAGLAYLLLNAGRKHEKNNLSPDLVKRFRRVMILETLTGAIFLVSAIPFFWIPVPIGGFLRNDVWYVTLAVFFVTTRSVRSRR
jgi:uncharacterized membrane protein